MVDEYQDTNRPQYLLMQRLAGTASQPLRRRRSGPVDLQVARRRPAQHPRLRARLPGGEDRPARAQLPVDAGHSRRGVRRHLAEPQPQGEAALHRAARAARRSSTTAPATTWTKPSSSHAPRGRRCTRIRRTPSPFCIAPTRSRERLKTRCAASGTAYKIIGGVRFYERKEIKDVARVPAAASSIRTTTSACAASSTCRRAASARA